MKSKRLSLSFFTLFLLISSAVFGQIPQVPAEIEFADIIVRINPQARREIQLDVDAQYRNPTYFKVKQERVHLYMPTIERVLKENGVPVDFKYLVIQESGLIADAVSTSNAVGFWQFKQGTAEEVSLRVDAHIDERKNIVSSTRGAALYLRKHNNTFDNWMCTLVSYQMGLGGAKAYFGTQYNGKQIMEVDRNTHWYFKKFLAHKIAFESLITYFVSNKQMMEVPVQGPSTLANLAKKYGVTEDHMKEFNKWTSNGKIPGDRTYTLVYIKDGSLPVEPAVIEQQPEPKKQATLSAATKASPAYKQANSYPKISGNTTKADQPNQITVNELNGVQAAQTTTQGKFSNQIGLKENKLRKLNDLEEAERIEAGKYYYTEKKKPSADVATHVVQPGESLWSISQKYGIRLSALKAKNRIRRDTELKVGMILNLQESRSRGEAIPILPVIITPSPQSQAVAEVIMEPEQDQQVYQAIDPYKTSEPSRITHSVARGETLFAISKKYGVSVEQLKSWNNIGSQNIISIGQKLVILKP